MHSVALAHYEETRNSEFRGRLLDGGNWMFPFDEIADRSIEKESHAVGILMVWSVIAIESFANHALAELIKNRERAVRAIEHPSRLLGKHDTPCAGRSELAKKLVILGNTDSHDVVPVGSCDKLADIRNALVHDKPFDYFDHGDGDVEIDYYRLRGKDSVVAPRYESLTAFFKECDRVSDYIVSKWTENPFNGKDHSFCSLLSK